VLFLLSIALVIGALVLLVLGLLVDKGLGLIYTSIAASVVAAIVLIVSVRLDRDRPAAVADGPSALSDAVSGSDPGPTSVEERGAPFVPEPTAPVAVAPEPAPAAAEPATVAPIPEAVPDSQPAPIAAADDQQWAPAEPPVEVAATEWAATGSDDGAWADDDFFPIADYDELTVPEILPLLPQLYPEEIPLIEERERATKNRTVILDTLTDLRSEVPSAPEPMPPPEPAAAAATPPPPTAAPGALEDLPFPIEDYDDLTAPAIIGVLDQLEPDELAEVRAHEAAHAQRTEVLEAIDQLHAAAVEAPSTPAAVPEKAPAKKSTSKKSAAKKAAAAKAPARRTVAEQAAVEKPAAEKAPAKKAAAKKTGAKRAATGKAAAKKTTATKKATTAKKASAKKAAAKKATTAKKASANKAPAKKAPAKKATKKRS
jgi:hypothetical protein